MNDPIAKIGIPVLILAVAILVMNSALFSVAAGIIAFVIALTSSSRRANKRSRLVPLIAAALALLVAGYIAWGSWVLTGSPTEWPRNLPYPDKMVIAVHESMHSPRVMPFDNTRTLNVLGAFIVACSSLAGWFLGSTSVGTALISPQIEKTRRHLYYRCTLGAALGLVPGLFLGAMLGKSFPPILLLFPIGAFVGAAIGASMIDKQEGEGAAPERH